MKEGLELEVETVVEAPREVVFSYFTDPEMYARWQGQRAELDPKPGGLYRVVMPLGVVRGTYLAVDPPSRVVFTWGWEGNEEIPPGSTTVEVTLEATGDETVVRLRHYGFTSETMRSEHQAGWKHYIERLRQAGSGEAPPPDRFGEP